MSTNTKLTEAARQLDDAIKDLPDGCEGWLEPLDERIAELRAALAAHDAEQALDRDPISDAFKAGMAAMEYAIWEGKEPCPCRKQAAMLAAAPTPPAPDCED